MNDHEIYDYDDTLAITNTRKKQLEEEALAHHGILGMKWGIRRYQNEDGSLTELGQRHYDMLERKQELEYDRRNRKEEADVERQRLKYQRASEKQGLYNQRDRDVYDFTNQERERKLHRKNVLTAVAVGALAVGGGIALHHYLKNKGNTPIDAPELTTTISTGKDNVQRLLFNTNGINNGTANYNFGGSGKSASTFGQTKVDDLKKLMDSSSKAKTLSKGKIKIENLAKKGNWGVAADDKQDVLEKLDSFTSLKKPVSISRNGKWEADNGTVSDLSNILAKRRQAQLNSNTAADMLSKQRAFERRKNLAGQIFEPGVRADKKGDVNWDKLAYRRGMKIPEGNDILSYAEKMTNPLTSRSTSTVNPADLLARKAAYDTSVSNLGSNLDKTLKKFKHSDIGDAYDMIDSKLMHTAMAISSRRRAQLENRDDYLMHYGRKGMKWGEDIFAEDELKKRQISGQSQYAQQLQAEAYKRKYGTQNTYTPSVEEANAYRSTQERVNGARIREQQKKQREAIAKYGTQNAVPASEADMTNGARIREQQKKQREAIAKYGIQNNVSTPTSAEPRQKHDPTINVMGKQVNLDDIEKYKNYTPEQAKNEVQERAKNEVQERATDAIGNQVESFVANDGVAKGVDKGTEKAKDIYEYEKGIHAQKAIYGDAIPNVTANSPSRALIDNAYKKVDTIEQSDDYRKLFGDVDPNKKSSGKQKMAEENYVKSKLEQQYANEIQSKYDNGEIDEDEYNRSMQMMPLNVANIYSGHELFKRYNGKIPGNLVDQMGRGSPAAGNITYDEALKYDNRDRYGMIAPDRGVRIYNSATPAPKSIEERQQEDAKKEADMAEREAHKQKVKSDAEDLAKDTAQTIDNINKGNTGNNAVDTLINAKNNRYKMLYDMVVPTKETNKTENRRLDTANENNSSPDKLKKKLKV